MLSRREWFGRLLVLAGVAGFSMRGPAETPANQAPAKVSQADAHYQDHPNNMQMCGMCKFYIPPGGKPGSGMMAGRMGPGMMGGGHMGPGMMGGGHMGPGMMATGTCQLC
jgi:hypothetical protein